MQTAAQKLADNINHHAWDGKWYLRAFDDEGVPVGSDTPPASDNGEGRIFMNPQSWAIISGVASPERATQAVAAVKQYLDTGYGMVLNWPAFTSLKPRIGQMTAMTPGFYENASVYVHGNCFWIYALACAGRGEEAWAAVKAILPDTDNKPNGDTEAFIIPNYYIGPNVKRRMQRNLYLSGWRTGSASFIYMTGLEWILGCRAEYEGLRIDPHLPAGWKTASVTRPFRGDVYAVSISNPSGKAGATVQQVTVDGKALVGNLITPIGDGKTHAVTVVMA